jgi:hypothetical protein
VDAASTVSALNRLIDDAGKGQAIFFDIYTEAENQVSSTRNALRSQQLRKQNWLEIMRVYAHIVLPRERLQPSMAMAMQVY